MNKQAVMSLVLAFAAEVKAAGGMGANVRNPVLCAWVDYATLTGALTFLMLLMFFYIGFRALASVDVPPYQIQGQDNKKQENVREWSQIWGNIEK